MNLIDYVIGLLRTQNVMTALACISDVAVEKAAVNAVQQ